MGNKDDIKSELLSKLKREHCFWSFDEASVGEISDESLIEKVLIHLDIPEIDSLFAIYPFRKIKRVWLDSLVPQGKYLFALNRFFAWYYFRVKNPDTYLKSMETRYLNRMFS